MSIESIPYADYRARPGLSSGMVRNLLRSPLHARYRSEHDEDSAALAFGRYVHAAVLEPETVMERFVVKPEDLNRRTNAGKAAYAELQSCGKQIVTADEIERGNAMRAAIMKHKAARTLMEGVRERGNRVEESGFWEQGGIACKCRWDALAPDTVLDLKTTTNANRREFEQSINQYGYAIQGAFYMLGARACGLSVSQFVIIAAESEAPHGVAVYRIEQGFLDAAEEQIESAFGIYRKCIKTGEWGGYSEEIQDVLCPAWLSVQEV